MPPGGPGVPGGVPATVLPEPTSVLAVCAHPDDESFGLGAVLDHFARRGAAVAGVCFTHGEASTLGPAGAALREVRRAELAAAGTALGIGPLTILDHPDGALASVASDRLAAQVAAAAAGVAADLLVVFDEDGVTGHPDHRAATAAALAATPSLPVLGWTVPRAVAGVLNAELGTGFGGRTADEVDLVLSVDRGPQHRAIACHASQSVDNPVLWRRLELLGDREWLRWLRRPPATGG